MQGRTNTGVRREPLGVDRTGTRYYDFDEKDGDYGLCRVFAQTLVEAPPPPKIPPTPGGVSESVSELPQQLREVSEWKCYASKQEVKALYRALDDAFEEERDLKNALADRYHADRPDEGDNGWLKEGNEARGSIIAKKYGRTFKQGVVTGFVPEGFEEQDGDVQQMDLWHVEIDDGVVGEGGGDVFAAYYAEGSGEKATDRPVVFEPTIGLAMESLKADFTIESLWSVL